MHIHIHHHHHADDSDSIRELLFLILKKQETVMATLADIQAQNDALTAAVAAEDTVIGSAITLIGGFGATLQTLKDELATAIANGLDPAAAQAVVDSMGATIGDINSKKDALAAAVAANTPTTPAG